MKARRLPLAPSLPLVGFLLLALFLDVVGCAGLGRRSVPAVAPAAELALERARAGMRAGGLHEEARNAAVRADLEAALSAQPDWVAPQRLLDDLARQSLLGAEAFARRRAQLQANPLDAAAHYLVGRLEGEDGEGRYRAATTLSDDLAWGYHGQAWLAFGRGELGTARRLGRMALARARGMQERAYFGRIQARYEMRVGRSEAAVALLEELVDDSSLSATERIETALLLVRAELSSDDEELMARGFQRGLAMLRSSELFDTELEALAEMLSLRAHTSPTGTGVRELELALSDHRSPARARLLDLKWRARGMRFDWDGEVEPARVRRFARGDAAGAIEEWRAGQPRFLLDEAGLPKDALLRRVVGQSRRLDSAEERLALAQALLDAGWFIEARAWAEPLSDDDVEQAFEVIAHANRGLTLLAEIEGLLERIDEGQPEPTRWVAGDRLGQLRELDGDGPATAELDGLLAALGRAFERYHGGAPDDLVLSPRLSYPPLAQIVHPGPRFSDADESAGLGEAGEPVPGLAAEFARLGRFGLFGNAVGSGGADGTVLRRLFVEWRAGEHLGVPFAGTVVWCEGTDVPSRPMRRGARITGAALHEGYWIDIAGARSEFRRWQELARRWLARPEGVAGILASSGPSLAQLDDKARETERRRALGALGEADRIRIAVLAERYEGGEIDGDPVSFEELVEAIARHEEGHLTDRTRFLPLTEHLGEVLALLLQAGLSPPRVNELLEYRAELVALCTCDDPRLPLIDCVDALENGTSVTPHASAYKRLLKDFLVELDGDAEAAHILEPDRYLLYQLHLLGAEDVRRVAHALARRRGMLEE